MNNQAAVVRELEFYTLLKPKAGNDVQERKEECRIWEKRQRKFTCSIAD
ncbi:hypothetical protein Q7A53_06990 [Halobacillus rhizosphaerae]